METSALDSSNVEAAFNEVLTGWGSVALLDTYSTLPFSLYTPLTWLRFVAAIHKKVSSRQVTRGSINAVTLSRPIGPEIEAQKDSRGCCSGS